MTSTAVAVKSVTKNSLLKKKATETKLVERFSETVKLEINADGELYLDKTKVKAVKKFQKQTLKNTLPVVAPLTTFVSGAAIMTYLYPTAAEIINNMMFWIPMFGILLATSVQPVLFAIFAENTAERRVNFIIKNSETVVEKFLFARGITVDQENLTAVTENFVSIFTDKDHDPNAKTYNTTDGDEFRLRTDGDDIKIELIQTATLETKQTVLKIQTQLPSHMAVVDQIKNKTLQLSTQQLTAENAYAFRKAQENTKKALQLGQQLHKLNDNNWEQALNASLQPINTDLEAIIEECRNEKRQQLASIRS